MEKFPPEYEKTVPKEPAEKSGLFERWFKKRKNAGTSRSPEASAQRPETAETKTTRFAKGVLRLFGLEPTEKPQPEAPASGQETRREKVEETASTARLLGEATLRFVSTLLKGERQREDLKAGRPAETLQGAAEDLQEALSDLDESVAEMPKPRQSKEGRAGDTGDSEFPWVGSERAATSLAEHTAEVSRLVEIKEKAKFALATAGLGVVAVGATLLVAYEMHQSAKERRRHELDRKKDRKLLKAERAQLREQQAALERLQVVQPAQNTPDRRSYYNQVSEFTHHQADVTRDVAREVRQFTVAAQPEIIPSGMPEVPRQPRRQSEETVFHVPTPAERQPAGREVAPVLGAERQERTEFAGRQPAATQGLPGGGEVSASGHGRQAQAAAPQTPLDPLTLREEAARKAAALRRSQFAWLSGLALLLGLFGFVFAFLLISAL